MGTSNDFPRTRLIVDTNSTAAVPGSADQMKPDVWEALWDRRKLGARSRSLPSLRRKASALGENDNQAWVFVSELALEGSPRH